MFEAWFLTVFSEISKSLAGSSHAKPREKHREMLPLKEEGDPDEALAVSMGHEAVLRFPAPSSGRSQPVVVRDLRNVRGWNRPRRSAWVAALLAVVDARLLPPPRAASRRPTSGGA